MYVKMEDQNCVSFHLLFGFGKKQTVVYIGQDAHTLLPEQYQHYGHTFAEWERVSEWEVAVLVDPSNYHKS